MDGNKKYVAFSIPRREAQTNKEVSVHIKAGPVKADLSIGANFAEIEYESNFRSLSSTAPALKLGPRAVDPIREKFFNMRRLTSGIPFARNDPGLFYKQARFMEDFADDYRGTAPFFMYYPCYQHMGYEQLRTYFTWRAKARRGETPPISSAYVFLYIYELLSGIGVRDPADGLIKLTAIWYAYRAHDRELNNSVPGWLKDYHIYYELPHSFADFVADNNLKAHYPDSFLFGDGDHFAHWSGISGYDVAKSKFVNEGNVLLMADCFDAVLNGIRGLCESHSCRMEDLLVHGAGRLLSWYPFQRALFYPWRAQPDRRVEISGREVYECKDGRWTAKIAVPYPGRKEFIGYVIKKTEACLRQAVKYKYKITANPDAFAPALWRLKALKIPLKELNTAIEKSVTDFHKNQTRTVVVVDHENLNRIRKEALGTRDKLIVQDAEEPPVIAPVGEPAPSVFLALSDWENLKNALSGTELNALSLVLRGAADMKAFADENNIMLEVLADSINEKAVDYVGDNIMELADGMVIYDEYIEKVAEMVG